MPYIPAGRRRVVSLLTVLALGLGMSATAQAAPPSPGPATTPDSTQCMQPNLGQPFLGSGDFNYYAPAPGLNASGFDGSTWTLTGGASAVSTQLADGSTGPALDLPAGSQAVSPAMCVLPGTKPQERALVRSLTGGGQVQVFVSWYTANGWTNAQGAGNLDTPGTGWSLANPQNLPNPPGPPPPPGATNAWQVMRFILVPGGGHNEYQVSGLSVSALPPAPDTGPCADPTLTQAFLPIGDTNYYTQAPDFSSWTLGGGAQVESATLADGSSGPVLDLPAGSMAVSPPICVTTAYPTARMLIRSLNGGDDLSFRVSYSNTNTWTNPHETGHVNGNLSNWAVSDSVQLKPANCSGWELVRLTLVPTGGHSEFQVYDLQLDPYAKR